MGSKLFLRIGCMSSSRWPTAIKNSKTSLEVSYFTLLSQRSFHLILKFILFIFFILSFNPKGSLHIHYDYDSSLVVFFFYGIRECENEWVSVSLSCMFSRVLSLLFVLPYSNVLVFVLPYFTLLLFFRHLLIF